MLDVVIPCFNEEDNIFELISSCFQVVKANSNIKFILVDNGSSDKTWELLDSKAVKSCPNIKLVRLEKNCGYGGGIRAGLASTSSSWIGWMHADLQTSPVNVLRFYDELLRAHGKGEVATLFKGHRFGRSVVDSFFSIGMSIFCSILFFGKLKDINGQPNIFHRRLIEDLGTFPSGFECDLWLQLQAKRYNFATVFLPVEFVERRGGESSWNLGLLSRVRFIHRIVLYSLRMRLRK